MPFCNFLRLRTYTGNGGGGPDTLASRCVCTFLKQSTVHKLFGSSNMPFPRSCTWSQVVSRGRVTGENQKIPTSPIVLLWLIGCQGGTNPNRCRPRYMNSARDVMLHCSLPEATELIKYVTGGGGDGKLNFELASQNLLYLGHQSLDKSRHSHCNTIKHFN